MVCTLSATFPLKILYPTTPWSLQPSLPLIPRFPTSSSLSVNPSGPSSTCIRRLSLTPTRNLLDCLDPATLPFHQMSEGSSPKNQTFSSCSKKASPAFSSGHELCNKFLPCCHPDTSDPDPQALKPGCRTSQRSTTHPTCSFTRRATASPHHLPLLSFLQSL